MTNSFITQRYPMKNKLYVIYNTPMTDNDNI